MRTMRASEAQNIVIYHVPQVEQLLQSFPASVQRDEVKVSETPVLRLFRSAQSAMETRHD